MGIRRCRAMPLSLSLFLPFSQHTATFARQCCVKGPPPFPGDITRCALCALDTPRGPRDSYTDEPEGSEKQQAVTLVAQAASPATQEPAPPAVAVEGNPFA